MKGNPSQPEYETKRGKKHEQLKRYSLVFADTEGMPTLKPVLPGGAKKGDRLFASQDAGGTQRLMLKARTFAKRSPRMEEPRIKRG